MLDSLFYTLSETSALTNQNKETLKKKCQSGQIDGVKKIGGVWLVPKEYVHGHKILRAGVYIDNANILHGGQKVGWSIDYEKTKNFIERRYNPKVLSIYDSQGNEVDKSGNLLRDDKGLYIPHKGQTNFFNTLQGLGYRVVKKPLKYINGDPRKPKNNMDANIIIDIWREVNEWDVLLLFSGDSDFDPLIEQLIPEKKKIHVFSFSSRLAYELKVRSFNTPSVCYTLLDDLKSVLARTA